MAPHIQPRKTAKAERKCCCGIGLVFLREGNPECQTNDSVSITFGERWETLLRHHAGCLGFTGKLAEERSRAPRPRQLDRMGSNGSMERR